MKKRLDQLLVEQGHVTGRDRAKSLIMAGQVYVNGQKADKAGDEYKDTDAIEVRGERLRYVSRGGLKLEKAMTVFPISLNKPQFEAGKDKVGKKGVVRDPKIHEEVIHNVLNCMISIGFSVKGISFSPVKGPEGNIEYLLYAEKTDRPVETPDLSDDSIQKLVEEAHRMLSDAKE